MTTLNNATQQFGDMSKAGLDAAMQFAQVSFNGVERMFALNLEAAKVSFEQTTKNAKALSGVKDAAELNTLRTSVAETGMEFAVGYSKNFYNVASAAQAQYASLVEDRVSGFQKSLVDTLDQAAKSAPAGADVFVTALKSGLAASTSAMDNVSKAAKQATAFADTTFKAAAENTEKATKTATKRK